MDETGLRALIDDVIAGHRHPDDLVDAYRRTPTADLGFAVVDHHRVLRQGMPEAVYAPGKTAAQCAAIVVELAADGVPVVLSRADGMQRDHCGATIGGAIVTDTGHGLSTMVWQPAPTRPGRVVIASAGTADLPVAAECGATLHAYGYHAEMAVDCGVAGLHRLLAHLESFTTADAVVAVAGMEGALASVIGGLTAGPVIAVPTSVGYGASLEGVTALLAMLSSCAAGVTVVGIDNGYGAACAVARLLSVGRGSSS